MKDENELLIIRKNWKRRGVLQKSKILKVANDAGKSNNLSTQKTGHWVWKFKKTKIR